MTPKPSHSLKLLALLLVLVLAGCSAKPVNPGTEVSLSLSCGDTQVLEVDGIDYEITLLTVTAQGGAFRINGENTPYLTTGQTWVASNGFKFKPTSIPTSCSAGDANLAVTVPLETPDSVSIYGQTYNLNPTFCTGTTQLPYCGSITDSTQRGNCNDAWDQFEGHCSLNAQNVGVCQNQYLAECAGITNTTGTGGIPGFDGTTAVIYLSAIGGAGLLLFAYTKWRKR